MSFRSSRAAWPGCLRSGAAVLLLLISQVAAQACPLCYDAARQLLTIGVQLDLADRAVLAVPAADGEQWRIVEVVKGKDAAGGFLADPVAGVDEAALARSDPWLLVHDRV